MKLFKRLFKNKKIAIPVVSALVIVLAGAGLVYSQKALSIFSQAAVLPIQIL